MQSHSCSALLILLLKVFLKIVISMENFNLSIPHLQKGQSVKAWRILYTAATSGFSEEQQRALLPAVVDRGAAEQAWACKAAERTTLKEALDELEARVDKKLPRLVTTQKFFELKPTKSVTLENLAEFFFEVLDAGNTAGVAHDLIALKFLHPIPGASKLFLENETELEGSMTEERVIALFDKVKQRLQEKEIKDAKEKGEVYISEEPEKIPRWAEELQEDIASLKKSLEVKRQRAATTRTAGEEKAFYNTRRKKIKKKNQEAKERPVPKDIEETSSSNR